jgi:hypothetical protein
MVIRHAATVVFPPRRTLRRTYKVHASFWNEMKWYFYGPLVLCDLSRFR